MNLDVTVQAATWVDVDAIEVVVDGEIVDTIPIMPGDADPTNPVIRWRGQIPIQVQRGRRLRRRRGLRRRSRSSRCTRQDAVRDDEPDLRHAVANALATRITPS